MKYNTSIKAQSDNAIEYFTKLIGQEAVIEIRKVNPKRSLNQNSYLHLLLGIAGLEWGYTIDEVKTLWKREVSQNIFVYEKNGKKFLRSSADLDSKEMTNSIDQLKKYASDQGLYLPDANDNDKLMYYSNLIEQEGEYL